MFYKDAQQVYRVRELERYAWLEHGFGTKLSQGWPRGPVVGLRQIHSALWRCADDGAEALEPADALISNTPGRMVSVRTADCIPILIVDERLRAVAAVHAGWRGTVQQVAVRTVEALAFRYSSRPEDLVVAIGPGICGKCYTVGASVAAQFGEWFPERTDLNRETRIDLREANRRQLAGAGVAAERIYRGAPCTGCQEEEFHSHRRSGSAAGRMISAIGMVG